jgi:hypothetical protein
MQTAPTLGDAIFDLCANHERYVRGAAVYLAVYDDTAFFGYSVHRPDTHLLTRQKYRIHPAP